jgi:hypothetical protein
VNTQLLLYSQYSSAVERVAIDVWQGVGVEQPLNRGSIPDSDKRLFSTMSESKMGPIHLDIKWVSGAFFLRLKQPERENHFSFSSVEFKTEWEL